MKKTIFWTIVIPGSVGLALYLILLGGDWKPGKAADSAPASAIAEKDYHYLLFFGGEPKGGETPPAMEIISRGGRTLVLPGKWHEQGAWCSFWEPFPFSEGGVLRWETGYLVFKNREGTFTAEGSARPYAWPGWVYYEVRISPFDSALSEPKGITTTGWQKLPAKLRIPVRRPVAEK